jgi:putative hydrolase of the HAD superfamily
MNHISFDVWGTLFKSNIQNNIKRARFLKQTLKLDLNETYIELTIKDHGKIINLNQEKSGIQIGRSELFFTLLQKLSISKVEYDYSYLDSVFQEIFLENTPSIFHDNYEKLIHDLSLNNNLSILSNTIYAKGTSIRFVLESYFGKDVFKFMLFSDEIGFAKPHEFVYQELINNSNSEKLIHIGDSVLCDVESPRKYNIRTFQVHSNDLKINEIYDEIK